MDRAHLRIEDAMNQTDLWSGKSIAAISGTGTSRQSGKCSAWPLSKGNRTSLPYRQAHDA
jgi:hypothetical protein